MEWHPPRTTRPVASEFAASQTLEIIAQSVNSSAQGLPSGALAITVPALVPVARAVRETVEWFTEKWRIIFCGEDEFAEWHRQRSSADAAGRARVRPVIGR